VGLGGPEGQEVEPCTNASLHRTASQMRLKLAGAKWLPETALAILNLRLMNLAGRWDGFWNGPELTQRLGHAFAGPSEQNVAA